VTTPGYENADVPDAQGRYLIEFGGGRGMPGPGIFGGLESFTQGAYGKKFKGEARRSYGSFMYFDGRGEMIPNEDSYREINPVAVDQWGINVLTAMAAAAIVPMLPDAAAAAPVGPTPRALLPMLDDVQQSKRNGPRGTPSDPVLQVAKADWPNKLQGRELATRSALCDMIIPADVKSPAASAVGAPAWLDLRRHLLFTEGQTGASVRGAVLRHHP